MSDNGAESAGAGGQRLLRPATAAERRKLDEYARQLLRNPDIRETLRRHWHGWERGQIVAPGSVADRMERAFREGVDVGIRLALGAFFLMERWREVPEEP